MDKETIYNIGIRRRVQWELQEVDHHVKSGTITKRKIIHTVKSRSKTSNRSWDLKADNLEVHSMWTPTTCLEYELK